MITGPINVSGYGTDLRRYEFEIHQPPRRAKTVKIHLVETAGAADRLVKAHTRAGAERFVRDSIKPTVTARVPTQEELIAALKDGVEIEDATNSPQASIPEPSQKDAQ